MLIFHKVILFMRIIYFFQCLYFLKLKYMLNTVKCSVCLIILYAFPNTWGRITIIEPRYSFRPLGSQTLPNFTSSKKLICFLLLWFLKIILMRQTELTILIILSVLFQDFTYIHTVVKQIPKTFSFWKSEILYPLNFCPFPEAPDSHYFTLCFCELNYFLHISHKRIIQHLSVCDRLILFNIMSSNFIHVVLCVKISFLFKA